MGLEMVSLCASPTQRQLEDDELPEDEADGELLSVAIEVEAADWAQLD